MKVEEVIKKIESLIVETQEENVSIPARVKAQEQITGYLVFLSDKEAEAFRQSRTAYTERRIAESQFIYSRDESVAKATAGSVSECKEYRQKEVETEVNYERIKLFRMAVQKHIDAMLSMTNSLKWEARNAEKQETT